MTANDDAVCRMEVFFRDSTSGTVRVFYPSGKLYCITPYAHLRSGLRHGIETTWSESGKMMTRTEFVGGLAREVVRYHPNGQVASRLTKGPESLKIEAFDSLGRPGFYAMPPASRTKKGKGKPVWVGDKEQSAPPAWSPAYSGARQHQARATNVVSINLPERTSLGTFLLRADCSRFAGQGMTLQVS